MTKLSPAAMEFIEQMGLVAEADGFPRIACRIIALLTLRQRPVSFDEIAETLQISRASVSTNTRLLETQGFVSRSCPIGQRKDSFLLTANLAKQFMQHSLAAYRRTEKLAIETARKLPRAEAIAKPALEEIAEFHAMVIASTEKLLEDWNRLKARPSKGAKKTA